MPKIAQALIIGFVVALVVGGGMGWLLSFDPEPHAMTPLMTGAGAGALTAFIIATLAGNRSIANVSQADKRAALERSPPEGKALIFLVRRGYMAKLVGMNFEIDSIPVAQLKSPHFTCVAVPAGPHTITAAFGGFAAGQSKVGGFALTATPGMTAVIEARMLWGLVQGGIGLSQQTDVAAAKARLAGKPMTPPDVSEI
ncbi:MAG TPA: hypothetical protein VKU90_14510 [Caulobacteraceae bacterium]|nr:hypothetical protein [Caulobacteraceae bacterium]